MRLLNVPALSANRFIPFCGEYGAVGKCLAINVNISYLTRLETRTKEFKWHASHWVLAPEGEVKCKRIVICGCSMIKR